MRKETSLLKNGLLPYLKDANLHSKLNVTARSDLFFHWADWKKSLDFMKKTNELGPDLEACKESLMISIEKLKDYPVWLRNRFDTVRTNLHEVYVAYMDPKLHKVWFNNENSDLLISTVAENGPYIPIRTMRWFVKEIYLNFVYLSLLEDRVPARDFRLRFEQTISCEFENSNFCSTEDVVFQQFTTTGILIKFSSNQIVSKLQNLERVKIFFNDHYFKSIQADNAREHLFLFSVRVKQIFNKHHKARFYSLSKKDLITLSKQQDVHKRVDHDSLYLHIPYQNLKSPFLSGDMSDEFSTLISHYEKVFASELTSRTAA